MDKNTKDYTVKNFNQFVNEQKNNLDTTKKSKKANDTKITSTTVVDLIKEAATKGYRKVKVIFVKIKLSDFPKSTHNTPSVKKAVGTQKTEIFDVVEETSDIIKLLKNKDVAEMYFVK